MEKTLLGGRKLVLRPCGVLMAQAALDAPLTPAEHKAKAKRQKRAREANKRIRMARRRLRP